MWLDEFKEWVFVDPQFGLMARFDGSRSGYASVTQIALAIKKMKRSILFFLRKIKVREIFYG